eukprot:7106529-Ditylum_brightwellii.AAC.1
MKIWDCGPQIDPSSTEMHTLNTCKQALCLDTTCLFVKHRPAHSNKFTYNPTDYQTASLPSSACFVPVRNLPGKVISTGLIDSFHLPTQTRKSTSSSFSKYLSTLDLNKWHPLGNINKQEIDPKYWQSEINTGTVEVASDRSVRDVTGTYAVVLKLEDRPLIPRPSGLPSFHYLVVQS